MHKNFTADDDTQSNNAEIKTNAQNTHIYIINDNALYQQVHLEIKGRK